jgi:hypothetical protein
MILRRLALFAGIGLMIPAYLFVARSEKVSTFDAQKPTAVQKPVEKISIPKPPSHIKTPKEVHGIYMTSWIASSQSLRSKLVAFVDSSEINSVVIDIKDYTGKIAFETDDSVIRDMGSSEKRIADIREFIEELHRKNIYVIGRVAVFQDVYATKKKPDLAVQKKGGGIWHDRKGLSFIDPGATEYWNYIVHVSRASEAVGFDEINYDYIRFPSDGQISLAIYPYSGKREKQIVLEDFFKYLRKELSNLGIPTSADLFGLTTWIEDDLGIGQVMERAAPHFDFIAPMVYPSHYSAGFNGYKNPAAHPYDVIKVSLDKAVERLKKIGQDPQKLRPWIQDFDLGADYGVKEILAQKKAVYDAGLVSWMSWDPGNHYTQDAYKE